MERVYTVSLHDKRGQTAKEEDNERSSTDVTDDNEKTYLTSDYVQDEDEKRRQQVQMTTRRYI